MQNGVRHYHITGTAQKGQLQVTHQSSRPVNVLGHIQGLCGTVLPANHRVPGGNQECAGAAAWVMDANPAFFPYALFQARDRDF